MHTRHLSNMPVYHRIVLKLVKHLGKYLQSDNARYHFTRMLSFVSHNYEDTSCLVTYSTRNASAIFFYQRNFINSLYIFQRLNNGKRVLYIRTLLIYFKISLVKIRRKKRRRRRKEGKRDKREKYFCLRCE